MSENNQVQPPQTPAVVPSERTIADGVLTRIAQFQNGGDLKLPTNYSAENAVRSAWLILQDVKNLDNKPALEVCTRESVATALLDMVLQGLNPVKKQCYFIVYGNKLQLQKSYMGTMALAKRVANIKEVKAVPIYEGDVFEYAVTDGKKQVTKHEQSLDNIDPQKVKGAYAIVTYTDDSKRAEIMNMKQIRSSWEMGKAKGNSPAHKSFPDEMACKTVINRALKTDIGSSDDADLYEEFIETDTTKAFVEHQIDENANRTEIGFQQDERVEEVESGPDASEVKVNIPEEDKGQPVLNGKEKAPF
jgi:recombination protein RecT